MRQQSAPGVVNLRGKQYATVGLRIHLFRERHPIAEGWGICTDVQAGESVVVATATITDPEGRIVATGTAEEVRTSGRGVNATSAVENAETSAIGRALAVAGFSGDAEFGIASKEEVEAAQSAPARGPISKLPEKSRRLIFAAARDVGGALGLTAEQLISNAKEWFNVAHLDDFAHGIRKTDYRKFANQLHAARLAVHAGHDIALLTEKQEGTIWEYDFRKLPTGNLPPAQGQENT